VGALDYSFLLGPVGTQDMEILAISRDGVTVRLTGTAVGEAKEEKEHIRKPSRVEGDRRETVVVSGITFECQVGEVEGLPGLTVWVARRYPFEIKTMRSPGRVDVSCKSPRSRTSAQSRRASLRIPVAPRAAAANARSKRGLA
jgi:hypothetical protein